MKSRDILGIAKKHILLTTLVLWIAVVLLIIIGFQWTSNAQTSEENQLGKIQRFRDECPVEFQDAAFGIAVSEALDCAYSDLTEEMLQSVTVLEIRDHADVVSVQDLALLPGLKVLTIVNCGVVSMDPVVQIRELTELDMSGNQISDISCVANLPELTRLILSNNQITDIRPILYAEKVVELNFAGNKLTDVPKLSEIQQLQKVNLSNCGLLNIDFVENSGIVDLAISNNSIKDISLLASCKSLEVLYLYGYTDLDIQVLQQLEHFHSIFLSEDFDRSQVDFLIGNFKNADMRTKAYLVANVWGLGEYE